MSEKETVLYRQENGIAHIVLHRPEVHNAIDRNMLQQLAEMLDKIRADDAVRAVIITGAGDKAFSAGADIKLLSSMAPLEVRNLALAAVLINNKIETLGKS